jgi:polysaccharide deacetylase family sporulation protein PdaB
LEGTKKERVHTVNFFYVINGTKLKRYFIIFVAVLFGIGIIYSERENISVFAQFGPSAIYSVETEQKVIALTFDISWGDKRAEPILSILEEKNVKATFFLSSPWSQQHPELVQRMVKSGFEIGSHGHRHLNYSKLNDVEIRNEISTAHETIKQVSGQTPRLLRLPNGDFNKKVLSIAEEMGYKVIQWDTDSLDWMSKDAGQIINRVLSKAHPGDIVLMHASDSSEQTHEALPVIIDRLREQGYQFVTVSELIEQTSVQHREPERQTFGKIY